MPRKGTAQNWGRSRRKFPFLLQGLWDDHPQVGGNSPTDRYSFTETKISISKILECPRITGGCT